VPCGDSGYARGFGQRFCELLLSNRDQFSEAAKIWIDSVRPCIQTGLLLRVLPTFVVSSADVGAASSSSSTPANSDSSNRQITCSQLNAAATVVSAECYTNPKAYLYTLSGPNPYPVSDVVSVCKLTYRDWWLLLRISRQSMSNVDESATSAWELLRVLKSCAGGYWLTMQMHVVPSFTAHNEALTSTTSASPSLFADLSTFDSVLASAMGLPPDRVLVTHVSPTVATPASNDNGARRVTFTILPAQPSTIDTQNVSPPTAAVAARQLMDYAAHHRGQLLRIGTVLSISDEHSSMQLTDVDRIAEPPLPVAGDIPGAEPMDVTTAYVAGALMGAIAVIGAGALIYCLIRSRHKQLSAQELRVYPRPYTYGATQNLLLPVDSNPAL